MAKLTGKVALVTGSSRGIGRSVAQQLASHGASVAVNYVAGKDQAAEVVAAIERTGGKARAFQADMGRIEDIRRIFQQTIEHYGRLDIVVHSAAIFLPNEILDVSEEEFDRSNALNFKGAFFTLQEAARLVQDQGRIIFISSSSTAMSVPRFSVYGGTKAAGEYFVRSLAKEIGARGITVNTVSAGFTYTDMLPKDPAWRKFGAELSPFKRIGQPEEVAEVVAFLASDEARWVTGQNFRADGGIT
jgi:3-oxoacyl-[acyl-carrier protein] reductase